MPSHGRGGRSPPKRKPPLPQGTCPRSTGPPVARTATFPIPPAPNIETATAICGNNSPSRNTVYATVKATTTIGGGIKTTAASEEDINNTIEDTVDTSNTIGGEIHPDGNNNNNDDDDTTDSSTLLGGEFNPRGVPSTTVLIITTPPPLPNP